MPRDFLDHEPVFDETTSAAATSDVNDIHGRTNYAMGDVNGRTNYTMGDVVFAVGGNGVGGAGGAGGIAIAGGGAGGYMGPTETTAAGSPTGVTREEHIDGTFTITQVYADGRRQHRIVEPASTYMRIDPASQMANQRWAEMENYSSQQQRRFETLSQMRDLSRPISISNNIPTIKKPTINPTRDTKPRPTLKQRLLKISLIKWFYT